VSIVRLTGVYHADGGLMGELRYVVGKLRGTSHCALCDITHGPTGKKRGFQSCEASLPLPLELVHLNERSAALAVFSAGRTPCVVGHEGAGFVMLLDAQELEKLEGSVRGFEAALGRALARYNASVG